MPKLLQINVTANQGSTGKIAEQVINALNIRSQFEILPLVQQTYVLALRLFLHHLVNLAARN